MWYWSVLTSGYSCGDRGEALVPVRHRVDDAVRFGRRGDVLLAGPRQLEGIAHDPVAAAAGEHRLLHRHLVFGALVEPAADRGIFALVVLAHDVEIDVAGRAVLQRRVDTGQQPHRPQVDVLLEAAADRDQQPPQRDVVGHAGIADRAEKDRVVEAQLVEPVLRHHPAGLGVGLAAPVEFAPFEARSRSAAPPPPAPRCPPARPRLPMPSPAITATRYVFGMVSPPTCSCSRYRWRAATARQSCARPRRICRQCPAGSDPWT